MRVAVVLFFIGCASGELVRWKCREDAERNLTLSPSLDGVRGRYTAELCSAVPKDVTSWRLDLWYFQHTAVCHTPHNSFVFVPRKQHSSVIENIKLNCSYACLSVDLDLLFTGCFSLQSTFIVEKTSLQPYETYHHIQNDFQLSDFTKTEPKVSVVFHTNGDVVVHWYLGVPLTDFEMELCKINNSTKEDEYCSKVKSNCTSMGAAGTNELRCAFPAGAAGCYKLNLEAIAPWVNGFLRDRYSKYSEFCNKGVVVNQSGSPRGALAALRWAGGALAAAAGAALLAAAACRRRALLAASKRVAAVWRERAHARTHAHEDTDKDELQVETAGRGPDIILLYAREGPVGQRAVDALRRLLEHHTTGKVYDVHSAEVTALAARAPAEWVRAALLRRRTRVLLLQTPAAALYLPGTNAEPDADAHGLTLRAPLLGSRCVYRSPRFGDTLLQYALRLLADPPGSHTDLEPEYCKYYVAQFALGSGVPETEVCPRLVPYRRYVLPAAAGLLARDVGDCPDPGTGLQDPGAGLQDPGAGLQEAGGRLVQLEEEARVAAHEFALHVAAHPDYLADHLVLLP